MSNSPSSFFSQATNFTSAIAGGVDPRTGLYNLNIKLGQLTGNNNLGPTLPLTLGYSPLTVRNIGFGIGCSLGLSVYDTENHLLILSTGERYKVVETADNVFLQQKKLDSLRFEKHTDSYQIIHKTGNIEILTGPKNGFTTKVPTKIISPTGHSLTLIWDSSSNPTPRLTSVSDEHDILAQFDYPSQSSTTCHVWPGQSEGYKIQLFFQNGYLSSVKNFSLGDDSPLVWLVKRESMGQNGEWGQWLTGLTAPGGLSELVTYRNDGQSNRFPEGAPLTALPYVTQFIQQPGSGRPVMKCNYKYTDHNFLGHGSNVAWGADQDNLYQVMTNYLYGSTETRTCGGQTTTTTRSYNSFHLQETETTSQNGFTYTTQTAYYAILGQPFQAQPPQFQLPSESTTTWTDSDGRYRREVTITTFDDSGNPLKNIAPDGTTTCWTYYSSTNSTPDCPAEPNGFTRFICTVTTTPYPSDYRDAPVQEIHYRYARFSPPSSNGIASVILKVEEQHRSDKDLLLLRHYNYNTDSKAEFSRLSGITETQYTKETNATSYISQQTFGFNVEADRLNQTHSLTSHDKLTLTRRQSRSRFTGRMYLSTDAQGNEKNQTYDRLGRVLTLTLNPGTAYENIKTATYEMPTNGAGAFNVTIEDMNGNRTRQWIDSLGCYLQLDYSDTDSDKKWYTVHVKKYDELGRETTTTANDFLRTDNTETKAISISQTNRYDNWGQPCSTTFSDGVTHNTEYNPITLTTTTTQLGGNLHSGTQLTTYDLNHHPISVEQQDSAGNIYSKRTMKYDGLNRLRCEIDEYGNSTAYTYDAWGRVVTSTLPEGTVITRLYAPFTSERLLAEIKVNGVSSGVQNFDGLGRLKSSTSGGRCISYAYSSTTAISPNTVTTPDGQICQYKYIPELGNQLQSASVDGNSQKFDYHPITGAIRSALAGTSTLQYSYFPSGRLDQESVTFGLQAPRSTQSTYSVDGLPQTRMDISGCLQVIDRDVHGRVIRLSDPNVIITLEYDELDRECQRVARDVQTGDTLTTTLAWDDFNRETLRKLVTNHGHCLILAQTWKKNHQLSTRTTSKDGLLLHNETYEYDSRNRLVTYACSGTTLPKDEHGSSIQAQTFTYDAYSNITQCVTTFTDNSVNHAQYLFENKNDLCQLSRITNTHKTYPAWMALTYDKAGRLQKSAGPDGMISDYHYDQLGRLIATFDNGREGQYQYDAWNRLVQRKNSDGKNEELYYHNDSLMNLIQDDNETQLIRTGTNCVAKRQVGANAGTWLMGTDEKQSVLTITQGDKEDTFTYSPYGLREPHNSDTTVLGFNGEPEDPISGTYLLGNGYRAFHPLLMRFSSPDSLSPFGAGGLNPYAYCQGDPINRTDPTGHLSTSAILGITFGVVGIGLTLLTGGLALPAVWSVAATVEFGVTVLGVASDVTSIVSGALETASPNASSILGWVSLGTGLAGIGEAAVKAGTKAARGLGELSERVATIQRVGLNGGGKLADEGLHTLNPSEIRFTQISASNSTGNYTVLDNAKSLADGTLKPETLSPIRVMRDIDQEGNMAFWTMDNRRLISHRLAGLDSIPVREYDPSEMIKGKCSINQETFSKKYGKRNKGSWKKYTTDSGGLKIKLKPGLGKSFSEAEKQLILNNAEWLSS